MMATALDPSLWSDLPSEILLLVLRHLPFSSLFRFRAVCKHWNTLPTIRPDSPYLLYIPRDLSKSATCFLYDSSINRWDSLDLSFLPSQMTLLCSLDPYCWKLQISRFCSSGGLLCLWTQFIPRDFVVSLTGSHCSDYTLVVCNPLSRSCRLLPLLGFEYQGCVGVEMQKDGSSGAYKVFAVVLVYTGKPGVVLRYCVYDSGSDSWKVVLDLERHCGDVSALRCCSVIFEGVYYCVSGGGGEEYGIWGYNIKEERWVVNGVRIKVDLKVTQVLFVVSCERLLLVASVLEKQGWVLKISRIETIDENSASASASAESDSVSLPKNFIWSRGCGIACRDSIVLASHSKFRAVDLLSLSADVKELKSMGAVNFTPMLVGAFRGTNVADASFDALATV